MELKEGRILIIDNYVDILKARELYLKRYIKHLKTENVPEQIPYLIREEKYDLLNSIIADVNTFCKKTEQHDDMTMLGIKFK